MSTMSTSSTITANNNNNFSNIRGGNNGTSSGGSQNFSNTRGGNNGTSSGGSQACAACKYQRRKCTPGCSLAPYFPPEQQRQFLNAHKLFGVSNILKIIRNLDPSQKDEAMRTMIIQADIRATDPVGGCYRIIHELQCQIERDKAELQLVLHQLAICRAQVQAHLQLLQQQQEAATLFPNAQPINYHPDPLTASYVNQNPMIQQGYLVQDNNQNQWVIQQEDSNPDRMNDMEASSSSSSLHVNKEPPFMNECEDIKPLLGIFDDRQQHSLPFDHKDNIDCSIFALYGCLPGDDPTATSRRILVEDGIVPSSSSPTAREYGVTAYEIWKEDTLTHTERFRPGQGKKISGNRSG
ncbi:hypothetical protein NE237_027258 [Protea cynaroides]|uniref:LOB domain-containing protein n=1 Tax=Protea cynaroides TaxID=273540 RepID=A0A9Q0GP00_9MAGN|nr:hypothetical protein NE237_027258 [Protea cynaroides]